MHGVSSYYPASNTSPPKDWKAQSDIFLKRQKIKKKLLDRKKKKKGLNCYFKILSGPECKCTCVTAPLNCFLLPLESSSNASHGLGGFCLISSLLPSASSLIPLSPVARTLWIVLLPAVKDTGPGLGMLCACLSPHLAHS